MAIGQCRNAVGDLVVAEQLRTNNAATLRLRYNAEMYLGDRATVERTLHGWLIAHPDVSAYSAQGFFLWSVRDLPHAADSFAQSARLAGSKKPLTPYLIL
jgi:hypothetical protein